MRVFNFSSGPAVLPEAVLTQAAEDMLDWQGTGTGVMEMSHRGSAFSRIIEMARADLADLLGLPSDYAILFLQGGATQQFSQLPMNRLKKRGLAQYVVTGAWSAKALEAAGKVAPLTGGRVEAVAGDEESDFSDLPFFTDEAFDPEADYVHLCTNETIHGVEMDEAHLPNTQDAPLVADMSSHILSRPMDIRRYAMVYAGAQKNIGPSGLTVLIVRKDWLEETPPDWLPDLLSYQVQARHDSMLNTPPTFAIYVAGLVFQWLKAQGGVAAMERVNIEKAALLYACIDQSGGFYRNGVASEARSRMNVPFLLADPALIPLFLEHARSAGLIELKGHKSVGGLRASLYNALPIEAVRVLVDFMTHFAKTRA
jgi:phosphoserine aminotransferase